MHHDTSTEMHHDYQVLLQILNFATVISTGLMIWKGLGIVTNTESPIVVVLRSVVSFTRQRVASTHKLRINRKVVCQSKRGGIVLSIICEFRYQSKRKRKEWMDEEKVEMGVKGEEKREREREKISGLIIST